MAFNFQIKVAKCNNGPTDNEPKLMPIDGLSPLDLALDLDSLFGHIEIPIFVDHVWGDLILSLDTKYQDSISIKKIKTPHPIKIRDQFVKINSLPSLKLGVFDTQFGPLDIYLVFRDTSLSINELKLKVFQLLNDIIESNEETLTSCFFLKSTSKGDFQTTTGKLLNASLNNLLLEINNTLKTEDPVIFVETFGNKSSTITTPNDFNSIIHKVKQTFIGRRALKNIFIDICISSSLGNNLVTVPKLSLFDKLRLTPNYQLFFTDTISNLHMKTAKKNGKPNKTGKRFHSIKLNFYSTIKYKLDFDKTANYAFPLASSLLLSDLFGFKLTNSPLSIDDTIKTHLGIDNLSLKKSTCPYRTEVRCKFSHRKKALRKLMRYTVPENFSAFNTTDLFDLILSNLAKFTDVFKTPGTLEIQRSLDSKVKAIVSEYIMKVMFFRGLRSVLNIFSPQVNDKLNLFLPVSKGHVRVLSNLVQLIDDTVSSMINNIEKKNLLLNLIKYSPKINHLMKYNLNRLIDICFDNPDSDTIIKTMFDVYVISITKDLDNSFEYLQKEPLPEKSAIQINDFLKKFTTKNKTQKVSVQKILYWMLSTNNNYCDDVIVEWMNRNSIISALSGTKSFELVPIEHQTRNKNEQKKAVLMKKLLEGLNLSVAVTKNLRVTDEEVIRIVHGMFMYSESDTRISDVHTNLIFNFFLVRDQSWVKNRLNLLTRFVRNKENFFNFMERVKNWTPNPNNQRIFQNLTNLKIVLNNEKKNIYREIYDLDLEKWTTFSNSLKLQNTTHADIFYSVVGNLRPYVAIKTTVYQWHVSDSTDDVSDSAPVTIHRNILNKNSGSENSLLIKLDQMKETLISEMSVLKDEVLKLSSKLDKIIDSQKLVSLPRIENPLNVDDVSTVLFSNFRYRMFNQEKARSILNLNPDPFLRQLCELDILSPLTSTNHYRFNLKRKSDSGIKYIAFDYLDSIFKKLSTDTPKFTASAVLSKIYCKFRPSSEDWHEYIEDLLLDGYLINDSTIRGFNYFRLSN